MSIIITAIICNNVAGQNPVVFEEWATSSGTQNMFLKTFTETNTAGGVIIGGATLNADVKFYSTGSSPKIYFEDENISFVLSTITGTPDSTGSGDTILYHKCELQFHEADPYVKVRAFDQRDDYFNYYLAYIPKGMARVPNYEKVIYSDVFEDIDLLFSSNNRGWKYYYVIKPGADPDDIEFAFSGADSMYVNSSDELILATSLGDIVFPQAEAYQINSSGNKVSLAWQPDYELDGTTVNFSTSTYDISKPLVFEIKQWSTATSWPSIDNLEWSTYYGDGQAFTKFFTTKTNQSNNIWISGITASDQFPTLGDSVFITPFGGIDAVLLMFKNNGERKWATFTGVKTLNIYMKILSIKLA